MSACCCTGACRNGGICSVTSGRGFGGVFNPDNLPVIPRLPEPAPRPADGAVAICGACGLRILPVMGYVCGRLDCPCFLQVTCSAIARKAAA